MLQRIGHAAQSHQRVRIRSLGERFFHAAFKTCRGSVSRPYLAEALIHAASYEQQPRLFLAVDFHVYHYRADAVLTGLAELIQPALSLHVSDRDAGNVIQCHRRITPKTLSHREIILIRVFKQLVFE